MSGPDINLSDYPKPWILFWAVILPSLSYMCYALCRKAFGWSRGLRKEILAKRNNSRVAKIWLAEVILQRQLFGLSPVRWFFHILIFWGFLGLLLASALNVILGALGHFGINRGLYSYFFFGEGRPIIKLLAESSGGALLIGLSAATARRFIFRPRQLITEEADGILLFSLLWLTLSGFALEWLHLSTHIALPVRYSLVGYLAGICPAYAADQIRPWLTLLWTVHGLSCAALLAYLPHSKLMHSILAPLVIAMNAVEEHERKDLYWPDLKKHKATGSHRV